MARKRKQQGRSTTWTKSAILQKLILANTALLLALLITFAGKYIEELAIQEGKIVINKSLTNIIEEGEQALPDTRWAVHAIIVYHDGRHEIKTSPVSFETSAECIPYLYEAAQYYKAGFHLQWIYIYCGTFIYFGNEST